VTLENIAWIVGVQTGTMHESQAEWAKKIKGPLRIRRVYAARQLVYLALYDVCGVSYRELGDMFNRRHLSVVGRSLQTARAWVQASPENAATWERIQESVRESKKAEQAAHAIATALKV
jgi:hypothetical protein